MKIVAVVVLYRLQPTQSPTLRALARMRALEHFERIVVWDNSPDPAPADASCFAALIDVPVTYRHDARNPSLAKVYNTVVDSCLGDATHLLLLDQDTELPDDFIEVAVRCAAAEPQAPVLAPTIRGGGRLASPCPLLFGWGLAWRRPRSGRHRTRMTAIITSGAFMHRKVFMEAGLRFDERLRLYGIDTDMFRRIARHYRWFYILPIVVQHDLSFDSATPAGKVEKVQQMLQANRLAYSGDPWPVRVLVAAVSLAVRIRYALRYRELRFLR